MEARVDAYQGVIDQNTQADVRLQAVFPFVPDRSLSRLASELKVLLRPPHSGTGGAPHCLPAGR